MEMDARRRGVLAAGVLAEAVVGAALLGEDLHSLAEVARLAEVGEARGEGAGAEGNHGQETPRWRRAGRGRPAGGRLAERPTTGTAAAVTMGGSVGDLVVLVHGILHGVGADLKKGGVGRTRGSRGRHPGTDTTGYRRNNNARDRAQVGRARGRPWEIVDG